jgi:hypothetical protein
MTVQEFQSRARSTGSLPTSEEEVGKWIHQMRQNDKDDLYDLLTQRRSLDELIKLQETKLKEAGISYQSILEDMQTDNI